MKTYLGKVTDMDWWVAVRDDEGDDTNPFTGEPTINNLNPRFDLRNHSPDGFAWGYNGSGPAQLALAILADRYDDEFALRFYQDFKAAVIANFGMEENWVLHEEDVDAHMSAIIEPLAQRELITSIQDYMNKRAQT